MSDVEIKGETFNVHQLRAFIQSVKLMHVKRFSFDFHITHDFVEFRIFRFFLFLDLVNHVEAVSCAHRRRFENVSAANESVTRRASREKSSLIGRILEYCSLIG